MLYKVGETVLFLHESGKGIVKKITSSAIIVEDETGFERPFTAAELVKIHGTAYHVSSENKDLLQKTEYKQKEDKEKHINKFSTHWEIDLHFDDLVDQFGEKMRVSKDQALQKQLSVFKQFYLSAREKKMRKLIIIHGFGKGILREEIQIFLKGQQGVDFWDAPYTEFGHGAILVEIKYKY